MARALSEEFVVTVSTPKPGYPEIHLYEGFDLSVLDDSFPGTILRSAALEPYHRNFILRALREVFLAIRVTAKTLFLDSEVVIVSTPSIFFAPFSLLISSLKRATFVYDLRDLTWRYIRETARPSIWRNIASRILERVFKRILRSSDLVVAATPGIQEICIKDYGLNPQKIHTVMNGVSDELLSMGRYSSHNLSRQPVVTYVGLFGNNHGVEILVDVASLLPDVKFVLVGDGPRKDDITDRIVELKLGNVELVGYQPCLGRLSEYYRRSTIMISHLKDTPVMNDTAIPAKIFEYMAFEKPIVYAGEGVAISFLNDIGCAVTVPSNDVLAMRDAITSLLKHPDRMEKMGLLGRAYVEEFFRRGQLMRSLVQKIKSIEATKKAG